MLNGNGRVSEATREHVRAAIRELGYRPDLYASNLARRQTQLLGVVISNLQNSFFAETAQAIEEEAERHGHQISLMATNFSPERQRAAVRQLLGARIAGLAVMTSEHDEEARQLVNESGTRAVFLDIGEFTENTSIIRVDSRRGMRSAVEHLLQLGHRNLLYVRNSQKTTQEGLLSHQLRDQGFASAIKACKVAGLKSTIVDFAGPGADAGEQAIASVLGRERFTAVIAVTDTVAMGVYRGLQARGVRIPQDVSVVGFDNTYFSRFLNPPLTTVDVSRVALSRLVVSSLLGSDPNRLFSLPTTLVVRESTMPPPGVADEGIAARRRPKRASIKAALLP